MLPLILKTKTVYLVIVGKRNIIRAIEGAIEISNIAIVILEYLSRGTNIIMMTFMLFFNLKKNLFYTFLYCFSHSCRSSLILKAIVKSKEKLWPLREINGKAKQLN